MTNTEESGAGFPEAALEPGLGGASWLSAGRGRRGGTACRRVAGTPTGRQSPAQVMVCELHEMVRGRGTEYSWYSRDALEALSRRGGGGGVRKGEVEGARHPAPPRRAAARSARSLGGCWSWQVQRKSAEGVASRYPGCRRRLHSLQGWGVCSQETKWGWGWAGGLAGTLSLPGRSPPPAASPPSAREGGGVPVWPPGSLGPRQRKAPVPQGLGARGLHKVPSGVLPERREARVPLHLG